MKFTVARDITVDSDGMPKESFSLVIRRYCVWVKVHTFDTIEEARKAQKAWETIND